MLISTHRTKLIHAIVYFATHTRFCGKVKLFKLLYLLDFSHFRETGRSVTGLDYQAWKLGPVPIDLQQEWDALGADFAAAIDIVPETVIDYVREKVVPKVEFDAGPFTKRELRLLSELATRFESELTRPLVNFTHEELGPWSKIWDNGRGKSARIPYSLAIPDEQPNREEILAAAAEFEGIAAADAQRH
jgi:uncharacterized phage-associated protein